MAIKVVQSVLGKFHCFHLARHLDSVGMLEHIFSGYPQFKLQDQGIGPDQLSTYPFFWLLSRVCAVYMPRAQHLRWETERLAWRTFDNHVAANLPECSVFVGHSGSALNSGTLAQRRGAKYICDHGTSHITHRDNIMAEEFRLWGLGRPRYDPVASDRQLAEYEKSDLITVPSEFVRRTFIDAGTNESKIAKVPYGADLSRFSKVADPPVDTFNILFVGQVSLRKGVPYLLDAFRSFSHPNKRLTVVGTILPEVKTILDAKITDNIELTGPVPNAKLKEIMSRSHVMIVPSIEEGLAMVQGEALACGCPIISTYNTGAEDLIQSGIEGFIIPARDAEAITQRLEQLAQDPDLRLRMSEAALTLVKSIKGWETYGRNYVRCIERLVNPAILAPESKNLA